MKKNEEYVTSCVSTTTEVKRNDLTELVFIIDKSGSMAGFEADTVGGFNATIEKQRAEEGRALVSTVLFAGECEVIHDRVDIKDIKPMTQKDYNAYGCTALLDAIGGAIRHIGNVHKYARPEDVPAHTVFIITTDGEENASQSYSSSRVKELIKEKTEKNGWEFIFLAANIDAVETADSIGIRRDRAANYRQTDNGIEKSFCAMSEAITMVRKSHADKMNLAEYLAEDNK